MAHLRRMAVYIKQNENSRPVIILSMNVLHVYDLSKEGNENCDTSEDQNVSVLSSY